MDWKWGLRIRVPDLLARSPEFKSQYYKKKKDAEKKKELSNISR
jgi:hypothetical protein